MKVIIIEDETRAANKLGKMLIKIQPDISILAKIETVEESIAYFQGNPELDLIFSDIQLADGLCFEIYEQVSVYCPIIFTTAFDKYAIKAFKTNGIDYLLKPIDEGELRQAIQKGKSLSPQTSATDIKLLAEALLGQQKQYKSRFMVKVGDKITSISVHEIMAFYSFEKSTFVISNTGRKFILDHSLEQLEGLLDPNLFFRISRKYIIPIHACKTIVSYSNSRLRIQIDVLKDETIIVARERVQEFKKWLGN